VVKACIATSTTTQTGDVFSFLDGLVRFYKPDGSWRKKSDGSFLDVPGFPADIATQVWHMNDRPSPAPA
jgi:hypothetical protein